MTDNQKFDADSIMEALTPLAGALRKAYEQAKPTLDAFAMAFQEFERQYGPALNQFMDELEPKIKAIAHQAKEWQEDKKVSVTAMAEQGWFPNWCTFYYEPKTEHDDLDALMIAHLDENMAIIKEKVLELCPSRAPILEEAFALHEEKRYVASVPLFISQADGICSEQFTHFFSKDSATGLRASDHILEKADKGDINVNYFSEILLEPFKVKVQMSEGSSKSSATHKAKGPNRHGIIHGSRKHLDYGSEVNSYKALSFLAFIVFTAKDQFVDA